MTVQPSYSRRSEPCEATVDRVGGAVRPGISSELALSQGRSSVGVKAPIDEGSWPLLVGEYLNWQEGNPIVPFENARRAAPGRGPCRLHRWFAAGALRCTFCGTDVYCPCGQAELDPALQARLKGRDLFSRRATLDHVRARALGGLTEAANVAVACWSCNCSKGDRHFPGEWIPHRDASTYVNGGQLPDLSGLSRAAQRLGRAIELLDSGEVGPSVMELAETHSWRTDGVHRAIEEMFRAKAFRVSAHPCVPSSRFFTPVPDPSDMWAGTIWVDGWS